jgi:hypothetical protein
MGKIFVRHRHHAGQGTGRPRFAIVATEGLDLRVYKTRVRRAELEKMATELQSEIVYLPRGGYAEAEDEGEQGHRHRQHRRAED